MGQSRTRDVWRGLKNITGHGQSGARDTAGGDQRWATELNQYFNRFDQGPPPLSTSALHSSHACSPVATATIHQPSSPPKHLNPTPHPPQRWPSAASGHLRGRCSHHSSSPSTPRTTPTTPAAVTSRSSPMTQPLLAVCLRGDELEGDELEYRSVIKDFVDWCESNFLCLNTGKTREMVIDFREKTPPHPPVSNQGSDIELVDNFKYLGVHLNTKLNWTTHIDALYKKGQSRLHLLRRLRSFGVCRPLLRTFYDSVVASAIHYAVVCWGAGSMDRDRKKLNKLVRRAGSVLGCSLESVEEVGQRRTLSRLLLYYLGEGGAEDRPVTVGCRVRMATPSQLQTDRQTESKAAN
uniref:uncharacterized protein LOC122783097 n=1 Tax=Solea senegalensis TaxID=28829 RepID=UPI001CD8D598|nr:uncharacterized protein LOC122783097 [Solea senegalensis]